MPIMPENLKRKPLDLSAPLSTMIDSDELASIHAVRRAFGVDVTRSFQFWESIVARLTDGNLTNHKCQWDIEIHKAPWIVRIEVKYSQEFLCTFRTGVRPVFKFALPKGGKREKPAGVVVLVGLDSFDNVHSWVIPGSTIKQCKSITLTVPRGKTGTAGRTFPLDQFYCPPDQILPEALRAWRHHIHYDAHHHAVNSAATRKARKAVGDLFETA